MEPTQNVGPMPAEQRAKIKRLAEAATAGRWQDHALLLESADLAQLAQDNDQAAVGLAADMPSGPRRVIAICGPLHDKASRLTAAYIAAVSPDVTLATLAYVEQLEAENAVYKRHEAKALDTWLVTKQFITEQGEELNAAKAQLAAAEARATEAAAEARKWKAEAKAHAARCAVLEKADAAPYCEGQCGICDCIAAPVAPQQQEGGGQ